MMKRFLFMMISLALLLPACKPGIPYKSLVQTAIVQTQTAIPTATLTPTMTFTPVPTDTPTLTSTPLPTPTESPSQGMMDVINKLKEEKFLTTDAGAYFKLKDYENSMNVARVVAFKPTGRTAANFIISADVSWETDGKFADWAICAPGFVFHQNGKDAFAVLMGIGLGSPINVFRISGNTPTGRLGKGDPANVTNPEGKAKMVFALNGPRLKLFVDGKDVKFNAIYLKDTSQVVDRFDSFTNPGSESGSVALAMASGNATGFGFRVKMTNVEFWELPGSSAGTSGTPETPGTPADETLGTPAGEGTPAPADGTPTAAQTPQ
ncbi:MAG: hypothetical protein WCI88_11670 [Chloroflexota bacterium]